MTINAALETREIRVFLSSTFRDMDAERTYMVKQVFPKVRAACSEREVGFSEIDLRWGVSEEESKNGATVEICLKEIDRCRDFPPFFVGFLGERYGWVPKHDELAAYWEKHSGSQYAPAIRKAIERGISVTELEMELAVLGDGAAEKIAGHALFCLRDSKLTDSIYADAQATNPNTSEADFYDAGQSKLEALKHKIDQSGFLGLDNYTSIEQFGAAVENYLLAQLDRYFPADEVPSFLQRSNAAHAGFRFHRLQNFLPRADMREQMVKAIEQRIEAPSLGPILVTGPSGQGKSALMADLARHLHNQPVANQPTETWRVFDHYIGADNANHLVGWVDRILQTLHPGIQDIAGDIPKSPKDKIEALSTWISMAAIRNNCRYLFILDALDQLVDGGKNLDILTPQTLGPDGILIASAADDTPARSSADNWQTRIEVPPLTNKLRTQLVTDTLARYRKRLPDDLARKLASAPQSGSPLFLGLALEELRLDARHESLGQLINDILAQPDAEHLFLNNFLLDADNGRPDLPELAASFMALLGAARAGLTENELADLLAQPDDPIAVDTGKPRLPQIHISRLLTNLAPFLLNKQGRRAPMHRIFGKAALEYYGITPVHEHLYAHFAPSYGKGESDYNTRGAAEALHQITELAKLKHKGQKQARKQLISDLGYLHIPDNLYDDVGNGGEKLLLDALEILTEAERNQLKKHWRKKITHLIKQLDVENAKKAAEYIGDFGDWLKYIAQYPLALAVREPLMESLEKLLPHDCVEIAYSCNSLGLLYLQLVRFDEATSLLRRALAIFKKTLGDEHQDTATSIDNLAGSLFDQGDYASAEPLYRSALAIKEKSLGVEHSSTAVSINNLASLLESQGIYTAAESLYRRALAIMEKSLGAEHPDTATIINNLGQLMYEQDDYAAAEPLFRRALAIREKSLGNEHPDNTTSINGLGLFMDKQGDYAAAEVLYRRALAINEKSLGADHPDTAQSITNIAQLLQRQCDYATAEPLYRRALAINEKVFGTEHPDYARGINNLAQFLYVRGNYAAAEPLYRRALAIMEKSFGAEHPNVVASIYNLARFLHDQCEFASAEPLYRRALAINEKFFGGEHSDTSASLNNLAMLLNDRGDHAALEPLLRRLLVILEKTKGDCHEETLRVMQNLAVSLRNAGKLGDAEPLQREAVARFIRVQGEDGLGTAAAYSGLGALLKMKGELAEAEIYYRKALTIRERELGVNAEPTKLVRKRLDELFSEKEK